MVLGLLEKIFENYFLNGRKLGKRCYLTQWRDGDRKSEIEPPGEYAWRPQRSLRKTRRRGLTTDERRMDTDELNGKSSVISCQISNFDFKFNSSVSIRLSSVAKSLQFN
jgi:hypothetical protein